MRNELNNKIGKDGSKAKDIKEMLEKKIELV